MASTLRNTWLTVWNKMFLSKELNCCIDQVLSETKRLGFSIQVHWGCINNKKISKSNHFKMQPFFQHTGDGQTLIGVSQNVTKKQTKGPIDKEKKREQHDCFSQLTSFPVSLPFTLAGIELNGIDRMHKWWPKKIFFCLCANETNYTLKELFFCILFVLMRLTSTKTEDYFFGRHLCIRPIECVASS